RRCRRERRSPGDRAARLARAGASSRLVAVSRQGGPRVSVSRHVLSVTVRDQPGVLLRIAGLFARRGYNIESLSVAQTERPGLSRTTFVVTGEDATVEQVTKQLQKLIDVLTVVDHSGSDYVSRELMLIKVSVRSPDDRVEIRQIAQDFRARIVDVAKQALTFEVTGDERKIEAFINQMRPFGIVELVRTGMVALERTEQVKRKEQARGRAKASCSDYLGPSRPRGERAPASLGTRHRARRERAQRPRAEATPGGEPRWRRSSTTRTRTSTTSRARPSPSSATARRATPTR